jgi:hypothetical protein
VFGRKSAEKAAVEADKKAAKAEKKLAKEAVKAQEEAVAAANKAEKEAARAQATAERKDATAYRKAAKRSARAAALAAEKAARAAKKARPLTFVERVTSPWQIQRALTSARMLGPVVVPFALKAATTTRGWWDERRARQLGVTALEVAAFRGPTGATEARLSGLAQTVQDLQRRRGSDLQVVRFVEVTNSRLADLTIATRAAASMPSSRRRATLTAVGRDLDRIDSDLMTFLIPRAPAA